MGRGSARVLPLLLLTPLAAGQTSEFAWDSGSYYFSSVPEQGTSTCCGSQLVTDPAAQDPKPTCLCDVTAGACDSQCCCDSDCSYESLREGGIFGCTSNGTATRPKGYTQCSDQLVATNIPQHLQEQSLVTSFGGANGLLCVVADNSPARGAYFRDPVSTTALTAPQVIAEIDAALPVQPSQWLSDATATTATPSTYTYGAPILSGSAPIGPFRVPVASPDGTCRDSQGVAFLSDVEPFTCGLAAPSTTITASEMQALCATTLNASFVRSIVVRSTPAAGSAAAAFDLALRDVNASSSASFTVGTQASAPHSAWDADTGVCSSALTMYQLKVTINGAGNVLSVRAYLAVDTLTAGDVPTTRLSYGVKFEYDGAASNVVRPTSGRPGYVRGLPLIFAEGSSVRTEGMKMLPRSAKGACATTPTSAGASQVVFGEDLAASCTVTQTAAELEAACLNPPALADMPLIAALNASATTLVGVYGDSHPSTAADWVQLSLRYPQNDAKQVVPTWDATTRTCSNVLSATHLRVLFTEVGSATTPVRKVVGAELVFDSRSVQAVSCALGSISCPPTVTTVTATATFAKLDSVAFAFVPESPQLIPPLPYDFFYPFFMSSNPAR